MPGRRRRKPTAPWRYRAADSRNPTEARPSTCRHGSPTRRAQATKPGVPATAAAAPLSSALRRMHGTRIWLRFGNFAILALPLRLTDLASFRESAFLASSRRLALFRDSAVLAPARCQDLALFRESAFLAHPLRRNLALFRDFAVLAHPLLLTDLASFREFAILAPAQCQDLALFRDSAVPGPRRRPPPPWVPGRCSAERFPGCAGRCRSASSRDRGIIDWPRRRGEDLPGHGGVRLCGHGAISMCRGLGPIP